MLAHVNYTTHDRQPARPALSKQKKRAVHDRRNSRELLDQYEKEPIYGWQMSTNTGTRSCTIKALLRRYQRTGSNYVTALSRETVAGASACDCSAPPTRRASRAGLLSIAGLPQCSRSGLAARAGRPDGIAVPLSANNTHALRQGEPRQPEIKWKSSSWLRDDGCGSRCALHESTEI